MGCAAVHGLFEAVLRSATPDWRAKLAWLRSWEQSFVPNQELDDVNDAFGRMVLSELVAAAVSEGLVERLPAFLCWRNRLAVGGESGSDAMRCAADAGCIAAMRMILQHDRKVKVEVEGQGQGQQAEGVAGGGVQGAEPRLRLLRGRIRDADGVLRAAVAAQQTAAAEWLLHLGIAASDAALTSAAATGNSALVALILDHALAAAGEGAGPAGQPGQSDDGAVAELLHHPLRAAAAAGHVAVVEQLLGSCTPAAVSLLARKAEATPANAARGFVSAASQAANCREEYGPLEAACAGGHVRVAELLLQRGFTPTAQALEAAAAKQGSAEVGQLLLQRGVVPSHESLCRAAARGCTDWVCLMLQWDGDGAEGEAAGAAEQQPGALGRRQGRHAAHLLAAEAKAAAGRSGCSYPCGLMDSAAYRNQTQLMEVLRAAGVAVTGKELEQAALSGAKEAVVLLLEWGCPVTLRALAAAAARPDVRVLQLLLHPSVTPPGCLAAEEGSEVVRAAVSGHVASSWSAAAGNREAVLRALFEQQPAAAQKHAEVARVAAQRASEEVVAVLGSFGIPPPTRPSDWSASTPTRRWPSLGAGRPDDLRRALATAGAPGAEGCCPSTVWPDPYVRAALQGDLFTFRALAEMGWPWRRSTWGDIRSGSRGQLGPAIAQLAVQYRGDVRLRGAAAGGVGAGVGGGQGEGGSEDGGSEEREYGGMAGLWGAGGAGGEEEEEESSDISWWAPY